MEASSPGSFLSADAWNKSVKCATLLYHWKMADGHESIFRLIYLHQKWIAQASFKHDNTLLPQLLAQLPPIAEPRIWVCFHVGPYALLARALLRQGHSIAILLKDEVFEEQYPQYIQQFKRSFGREPRSTELCFVRSGGARSLIKLKQCLEKGFHVLSYIDGQEGAEEKGWTTVQLHGTPVDVRMGMAVLSHWTNTPLCPLVLTTDGEKLQLRYAEGFQVKSRQDYSRAMQYCYQILESLASEELIQWEFLPNLFDRLGPELLPPINKKPLWLPIDVSGRNRLFDLASKRSVAIRSDVFAELNSLRRHLLEHLQVK